MPVFGTSTITVTAALNTGVNLNYTVSDPAPSSGYTSTNNTTEPQTFKSGSGVLQINQAVTQQVVLPASGADTFNLNTGAVSGSTTAPLVYPGTGGATFTTTKLNLLEIDLFPGGSQTVTVTPAASNGFGGPISGSGSITINGSDSTGLGGSFRAERSDSIGWPVSSSKCNLVVLNNDSINAATFTVTFGG